MGLSKEIIGARRFGYGPAGCPPQDRDTLLSGLSGPDRMARRFPVTGQTEVLASAVSYRDAVRQVRDGGDPMLRDAARQVLYRQRQDGLLATMTRIATSGTPFRERLAWFWADHFTVSAKNVRVLGLPAAFVDEAIRPNLSGRFGDMLKAAVTHPAMVLYLDQSDSVGPESRAARRGGGGLNENLAREVLELHTLGANAAYTQEDVTQFAKLLTGLTFRIDAGAVFRDARAEPGAETLLGVSYGGEVAALSDILAALDDLALRPETAQHLSHKLAVHFVADDPPEDLVASLSEAYRASGGDLQQVYEALLAHPAAWSADFAKIRQPFEFIGAGLRAIGARGITVLALDGKPFRTVLARPLAVMGQPFQRPEGPNGWPEPNAYWLTPQGLAARIQWSMQVPQILLESMPEPEDFVRTALGEDDGDVLSTVLRAETRAEAVGLVLASPAFMRR